MQRTKLVLIVVSMLLALLRPELSLACKSRYYPESFPLDELKKYEHVYVVEVVKVNLNQPLEESWYAPPFSFEGKIIKTLKGPKQPSEIIKANTSSNEEPEARCPILLETGKVYLLMLSGNESPYSLPRYGSLYTSSEQPEFNAYIANIVYALKSKHKKHVRKAK